MSGTASAACQPRPTCCWCPWLTHRRHLLVPLLPHRPLAVQLPAQPLPRLRPPTPSLLRSPRGSERKSGEMIAKQEAHPIWGGFFLWMGRGSYSAKAFIALLLHLHMEPGGVLNALNEFLRIKITGHIESYRSCLAVSLSLFRPYPTTLLIVWLHKVQQLWMPSRVKVLTLPFSTPLSFLDLPGLSCRHQVEPTRRQGIQRLAGRFRCPSR